MDDHAPEVWLTLQQIKESKEFIREEADRVVQKSVENKDNQPDLVSLGKAIV